jgi:hypothetical protein
MLIFPPPPFLSHHCTKKDAAALAARGAAEFSYCASAFFSESVNPESGFGMLAARHCTPG